MLTNDTGAVTDTFQYDAWGNQVARTGTTPTPYTWVGRWGYQDDSATTGGYYIRARTYQPTVAKWTSSDAILFVKTKLAPGYFEIILPYAYVENRPHFFIDPSGLTAVTLSFLQDVTGTTILGLIVSPPNNWMPSFGSPDLKYYQTVGTILSIASQLTNAPSGKWSQPPDAGSGRFWFQSQSVFSTVSLTSEYGGDVCNSVWTSPFSSGDAGSVDLYAENFCRGNYSISVTVVTSIYLKGKNSGATTALTNGPSHYPVNQQDSAMTVRYSDTVVYTKSLGQGSTKILAWTPTLSLTFRFLDVSVTAEIKINDITKL